MKEVKYTLVGNQYSNSSQVPKDHDLFYRCSFCNDVILSIPKDSSECKCGNICIDIDYWRLDISNFSEFEVVKKIVVPKK